MSETPQSDPVLKQGDVPRAEIPFELTEPMVWVNTESGVAHGVGANWNGRTGHGEYLAGPVPSAMDFTIAELLQRFGGHVVSYKRPVASASNGKPASLSQVAAPHLPVTASLQTQSIQSDVPLEADPDWVRYGVEPDWSHYRFRGAVGRLLWERGVQAEQAGNLRKAHRLKRKAIRFVSCNKCARPGVCSRYPEDHKFFIPNGCEVVFCKECADEVRRELLLAYQAVILAVITKQGGIPDGWVLARINFTLRSDGSEITPQRVKKFNGCVREAMRRAVGSRKGFGMLFVDEVGFEKRGRLPDAQRIGHGLNLHCHGLYLGPRLDWEQARDLWIEVTKKQFGVESRGFYIRAIRRFADNPERAVRWALNHMLKYVSKPPAVTPDRLASLIAAFDGAKRVHSLGLFYGKKPDCEKRDCPCPKCKAMGIVSTVGFEGRSLPNGGCTPRIVLIEQLLAAGYVPLREAGRAAVLSAGVSREESWGASP